MAHYTKSFSGTGAPGIFLLGSALLSGMIWTIMSEAQLSSVFWPNDISRIFLSGLGGEITESVIGEPRITLSFVSVYLRVLIVVFAMALMSKWPSPGLKTPGPELEPSVARTSASSTSLLSAVSYISQPGLYAGIWLCVWFAAPLIGSNSFTAFAATITPYVAALILAGTLNAWLEQVSSRFSVESKTGVVSSGRAEMTIVFAALCLWEAISFWMNERLYAGLLVPHGDSAMYEEHLWNVWHGKGFRSYLDQGLFLGEHIQVIHLLLLPLHMLLPSYLTLEFCASLSLAICAIPVFSIAKRHSGSSRAAMWLALAWLFFFPMHFLDIAIDLKTLRPSCYGMPFLFWGIDLAERRKLAWSSLFFLVALSTQEDFALVVGSIGLVLFLRAAQSASAMSGDLTSGVFDRFHSMFAKWSLAVLLFSILYVLAAVLVVIPAFRDGAHVHYSRYFGDLGSSPGDLIRTALQEPGKVLSVFLSFRTLTYLIMLSVPLGTLVWRRPVYLLAGAPTFLMLSLIQLGNESGGQGGDASAELASQIPPIPFHHFHAPLLPVLLWAAAAGLSKTTHRVSWARFAFLCAVLTSISGSLMPMGATFWSAESRYGWRNLYIPGARAQEFEKVIVKIPVSAKVASTDYVHTRMTHFERSYDYSGYLRAVNDYQPGVPDDTDYIVLDTSHPYSEVRNLAQVRELQEEPEKWEVLPDETNGLFIVLKRRH